MTESAVTFTFPHCDPSKAHTVVRTVPGGWQVGGHPLSFSKRRKKRKRSEKENNSRKKEENQENYKKDQN